VRRRALVVTLAAPLCAAVQLAAATLEPATVQAWSRYVAATEQRIAAELASPAGFLATDLEKTERASRAAAMQGTIVVERVTSTADGVRLEVPGGTIQHWRGLVFLPGVSTTALVSLLESPPGAPLQDGVLALRVLRRQGDVLDVFIRMTHANVPTVTYDTEHHVEFRRYGPARASSRSMATRITEVQPTKSSADWTAADDRGFLWRMNSYWTYRQVEGGVRVDVFSVSLSRDVPKLARPIVVPVAVRVARESMRRTLDAMRQFGLGLTRQT